ncbi:IS66 family insertion sequence element accessory protein TnpB [Christensenellaceae bacterium OttesenSCG-928-M15]|nr:IS66 family insertion sequence element accessory protein TnpB [Christensenellaceae bacterium OttesenSCG-928-M15]
MLEKKRIERQTPRPCPNCGRDFVPMWEKGGMPRFCSDDCRIEWWREYHKAHPSSGESNTKCAYCGQKMDGSGGKYCSRACYRLGAAHVRGEKRCSWCGKLLSKKARSTQKYCCQTCAKAEWSLAKRGGPKRRCITAHNPSAWRRQLAELTNNIGPEPKRDRRILLVCGTIKSTSMDAYVDFIRYQLECDPFDGNRYVFCNNVYTLLKWFEWDGSGFCIGYRKAEWGKYPWPLSKTDEVMEISEQEFAFLYSKTTLGNEEETH